MRALLLVLVAACSSNNPPAGLFTIGVDTHTIAVGSSTFVWAFFNDGMSDANGAVGASWSAAPSGLVTLSAGTSNYEKVTADAAGQVVITAKAQGATAMVGFTIQ